MAGSTHRWRPWWSTKGVYGPFSVVNPPPKRPLTHPLKTHDDHCLLNIKFEHSPYFLGASVKQLFQDGLHQNTPIKIMDLSSHTKSSMVFNESLGDIIHKKLYASEYVEAKSLKYLTKMTNSLIRCYIISEDPYCIDDSIYIAELIKFDLEPEDWKSFKLIIVSKHFDIKHEILSNTVNESAQKQFVLKGNVVEQFENDIDEDMEDQSGPDLENDSTNTMLDEDEETKMIGRMAKSKFRDSRIILSNKRKIEQPEVDPIERCFVAIMKMLEDNIFSASKGLTEVNLQITHMMRQSDIDSVDFDDEEEEEEQKTPAMEEHHIKIFKI